MNHDIFICYDDNDKEIAWHITKKFEENNLSCWIKKRDYNANDVSMISDAIRKSRIMIIVYSDNAIRSNYVNTEIDIAFSSDIPILIFNIDDSSYDGKLKFYLKDKTVINGYDKAYDYTDKLLDATVKILDNPITIADFDVYLCYCDDDILIVDTICHILEENNIKCCFKRRDSFKDDNVDMIPTFIRNSAMLLLVSSENSVKSNYVNSEVKLALSSSVPVLSFNIDNNHKSPIDFSSQIDAYPDISSYYKELLLKTADITGKKIDKPVICDEYVKYDLAVENAPGVIVEKEDKSTHFNRIFLTIVLIGLVVVFCYAISNSAIFDNYYISYNDEGVSVDSYESPNTLSLVLTSTEFDKNHCIIHAKTYENIDEFNQYTVKSEYYDKEDHLINTSIIKMQDIVQEDDDLIIVNYSSDKPISYIKLSVFDENNKQVYYQLIK